MSKYTEAESLSAGSVFRLVAIGFAFGLAPFGLLCGVLAFFGAQTVTVQGVAQTGLAGLVAGATLAPFFGLCLGLMSLLVVPFGWWLYGKFFPRTLCVVLKNERAEI